MAKPMDDADKLKRATRRRLVGAVVLTIIIVTLIPLLLDNEPSLPQSNIELRIPNKDQVAVFNPKPPTAAPPAVDVENLDNRPTTSPTASVAASAASTPTNDAITDNAPATNLPEKNSAVVQKLATPPKPAPPANNKAAPKSGFIVQAGAFSNTDSAQDLQKKLSAIGIKTYTEKAGNITRVRAGAYPTRAAADKVARKLEAQGLKPVIISATTAN